MDVKRAVLDDKEQSKFVLQHLCLQQEGLPYVLNMILWKWVEPPWNDSVTLTLTRELRLNNNLLSWKFHVRCSFWFLLLSHSKLIVLTHYCWCWFSFLSFFFCLFVCFCPHKNLMAQELTNKKLFYNKVDCNQQLPGVTQWTKIQDHLKK